MSIHKHNPKQQRVHRGEAPKPIKVKKARILTIKPGNKLKNPRKKQ